MSYPFLIIYLCVYDKSKNIMSKNTEIKLAGQPILTQVLNLVNTLTFKRLVKGKKSESLFYECILSSKNKITAKKEAETSLAFYRIQTEFQFKFVVNSNT